MSADSRHPNVFGAQQLGIWVDRHPFHALSVIVITCITCLISTALWLKFEGEPSRIFDGSSSEYVTFQNFEAEYHAYSKDEIVLVSSPLLQAIEGIELLRELQFDIQLTDGIEDVVSIFSIAQFDTQSEQWKTILPVSFDDDDQVSGSLRRLYEENSLARSLISEDFTSAIILFSPKTGTEVQSYDADSLSQTLAMYRNEGLDIQSAGESVIERELVELVKQDTLVITALGILLAMGIAYYLFSSWWAVLICLSPLTVALTWYLGIVSFFGISIDVVTVIIPVLIIILSFADTVHLYLHWRRLVTAGIAPLDAIPRSISAIGPAIVLAATTTGIAFLVLMIASSSLLDRMATSGLLGILTMCVSVICVGPLALRFFAMREENLASGRNALLQSGGELSAKFYSRNPLFAIKFALISMIPLLWIHFQIESQFSLLDYLPKTSTAYEADGKVEKLFGGADQLILVVNRTTDSAEISRDEISQLRKLEALMQQTLGVRAAVSAASLVPDDFTSSLGMEFDPDQTPSSIYRFISPDLQSLTVTAPVPISTDALALNKQIEEFETGVRELMPDTEFYITGSSQMKAAVGPQLIWELRLGLLISVVLSIFVIGLSFGSLKVTVACFIPNILPILAIEFVIWVLLGKMDLSLTIALMIGFGLAVDDTVHYLNHYRDNQNSKLNEKERTTAALRTVGPALMATTIIIGLGFCTTAFASIPTVFTLALAVIGVLIFALIADMLVLPSALYLLHTIEERGHQRTSNKSHHSSSADHE